MYGLAMADKNKILDVLPTWEVCCAGIDLQQDSAHERGAH